jgi:hypothetical protein
MELEFEVGNVVTLNGNTGEVLEIRETPAEKIVKLKVSESKVALVRYVKRSTVPGLGTMRLE